MLDTDPRTRAASDIVRRLLADHLLDSENPRGVEEDLHRVLAEYEAEIDRLVEATRASTARLSDRREAFLEEAKKRRIAWSDEAVADLLDPIVEALESSEHVGDIFADDALLDRLVSAALMDYVAAVEANVLVALRGELAPSTGAAYPEPVKRPAPSGPPTFADRGYPFALFEGPMKEAVVDEAGTCVACSAEADLRFEGACYACFRRGSVVKARDTELGAVDAESLTTGLTGGVPFDERFDARGTQVVRPKVRSKEPWMRFRVAHERLTELLRTPVYSTWQGESWLFCCGVPMIYVGSVGERLLHAWSTEDDVSTEEVMKRLLAPERIDARSFVDDVLKGSRVVYAFRCPSCGRRRAHWDMD